MSFEKRDFEFKQSKSCVPKLTFFKFVNTNTFLMFRDFARVMISLFNGPIIKKYFSVNLKF